VARRRRLGADGAVGRPAQGRLWGGGSTSPPHLSLSFPRWLTDRSGAGAPPERRRRRGGGRTTARLVGGGRAGRSSREQRQQLLLLPPCAREGNPNGFGFWVQPKPDPFTPKPDPLKVQFPFSSYKIRNYFGDPEKLQSAP